MQIGAQLGRAGDGGGEPDHHQVRGELAQAGEIERQEVAALRGGERMQFVENDGVERAEHVGGVLVAQEKRKLLRRRHQDVGRGLALALALGSRGVAGAGFAFDGEPISAMGAVRLRATSTARALSGEM